jgi:signal transduction histidine kinase
MNPMKDKDLSISIKTIQRRLFLFVLRVIAIVLVLTIVINLVVMAFQLDRESRTNPFISSPVATTLEAYYLGHGSWEGVEAIFDVSTSFSGRFMEDNWQKTVLVSMDDRIILPYGDVDSAMIGSVYHPPENASTVTLTSSGRVIGKLYIEDTPTANSRSLIIRVVLPVLLFSIIPGLIVLVIGLLLLRRLVGPLSEVIGATQAVAAGDLSVRVPVHSRNDDLRTLSDGFNHMAETLERNDRERRDLFADIAHELRTPLTVLRGRLEGVMDGVYPPSQEVIAPALTETYLLERLVEDLRLLALAEAHQLHFENQDVELAKHFQPILDLFSAQASELQVTLQLNFEPDLPLVHVDPQRLEQVISNLLDNALRYAPPGSNIELSIQKDSQGVAIDVVDEGPGVPEDELPLIFNRFWREEKSRARSSGGSGLGLAIAKQLIEAQGGSIIARNCPSGGLDICILLPASA